MPVFKTFPPGSVLSAAAKREVRTQGVSSGGLYTLLPNELQCVHKNTLCLLEQRLKLTNVNKIFRQHCCVCWENDDFYIYKIICLLIKQSLLTAN